MLVHVSPLDAECKTSNKERRKSWQSYVRLKQASAPSSSVSSGYRPRTLVTNQSSATALLTPTSAAGRGGGTSPPAAEDSAQTHTTATLSPIASGSSSMSYAPKSSASTCGGTTIGAGAVGITPDDGAADGLVSQAFLFTVEQQLQHITSYVDMQSACLSTTVVCSYSKLLVHVNFLKHRSISGVDESCCTHSSLVKLFKLQWPSSSCPYY